MALLEGLPENDLRAVARTLREMHKRTTPREWTSVVGSMSDEDAEEMRRIIREQFGPVDPDQW